MIDALYTDYFQKSRMFLYPLLEIRRGVTAIPEDTYVSWKGKYNSEDMKLICRYKKREDKEFLLFEKNMLTKHNRLIEKITTDDEIIYVFDFSDYKNDWNHFINGKYNKMDPKTKRKILNFFDKYSANFVYMESYLFSGKYFSLYAKLLGVDINLLEEVGELCNKPDLDKETFKLKVSAKTKLLH
jgi:hypothetical protein